MRAQWGARGARDAARSGDAVVVVDTLRFSTAVAAAVAAGVRVWPAADPDAARSHADALGARHGRAYLSPVRCAALNAGERLVLPSPNGATCSRCALDGAAALWVGAPVNAAAVARAVAAFLDADPGGAVTLVACGERWEWDGDPGGALRFALEDWIGVGAVAARIDLPRSPEAQAAVDAYRAAADRLADTLHGCGSGIELVAKGCADDVAFAARADALEVAPRLGGDGAFDDPGRNGAGTGGV